MAGIYNAAVQGIESGFGMGLKLDAEAEARRRTDLLEKHQTIQDKLAQQQQDFTEKNTRNTNERANIEFGTKYATAELDDAEKEAAMAEAGGGQITPEMGTRHAQALKNLHGWRQQGRDLASRLLNGDVNINQVPGADLARMHAAMTGMKDEEWAQVPQAIKDANTALSSNNMPLALRSLNVLMTPELKRGLGQPSAHGGNVISKSIVDAVPALAQNGAQGNPDQLLPVVRVVTDQIGPDGQNLYYDAPMTEDGSVEGKIVPISIQQTIDRMRHLATLDTAFGHPELAAKLAAGRKETKEENDANLDRLRAVAVTRAAGLKMDATSAKMAAIHRFAVENNMTDQQGAITMQDMGLFPGAPKRTTALQDEEARARIDMLKARANVLWKTPPKSASGGALLPGADFTKTGPDFLATLEPQDQTTVRAIVDGREKVENVSVRNGRREAITAAVAQYDAGYSQQDYGTKAGVRKDFTSGVAARNVTAINTAIGHLASLQDLFEAQKNKDQPKINAVLNTLATELKGDPRVNNVDLAATAVGDELMRVFRQVGASEIEARNWKEKFGSALSPEMQKGALATAADLLASRIDSLDDQWKRGMGTTTGYPNLLSPKSRAVVDDLIPGRVAPPAPAPAPTPTPTPTPARAPGPVAAGVAAAPTTSSAGSAESARIDPNRYVSPAVQAERDKDARAALEMNVRQQEGYLRQAEEMVSGLPPTTPPDRRKPFEDAVTRAQNDVALAKREVAKLPRGPVAAAMAPAPAAAPAAAAPAAKPTLQQFMEKAKVANPTASEADLQAYYAKKYGGQ